MMKVRLICLLLLFSFTAMAVENADSNDKRAARKQQRLEKRQERQEKREERREERNAQKESDVVAPQASVVVHEEEPVYVYEDVHEDVALDEPVDERVTSERSLSDSVPRPAKETSSNDTPNNSDNTIEESSEDSQDDGLSRLVLPLIVIVMCVVAFFSWLFSRRCPKCKKMFGMCVVNETFMGQSKSMKEKNRTVYYSNIKVTRKCRHCGYTDYHIEERKGTKD